MCLKDQQFLSMAIAYLEIGKLAAKTKSEYENVGECENVGDYQNAVAYQLFHAVELFYKQMIKNRVGSVSHTHDLGELEDEYTKLYPDPNCKINHPFDFSSYSSCELNPGEDALYAKHIAKFNPKFMDQHLRYPSDERTGGYSFYLDSSTFEETKSSMMDIYSSSQ
jgi:hypothetical protein